jgi:hypothetical protein
MLDINEVYFFANSRFYVSHIFTSQYNGIIQVNSVPSLFSADASLKHREKHVKHKDTKGTKGLLLGGTSLAAAKSATGVAHKRKSNSVVKRWAMPATGSFFGGKGVTSTFR